MARIKRIKEKLSVLQPHHLEIIDESAAHANHFKSSFIEATHITIKIATEHFAGIKRIEQHKIITRLLKDEFNSGLHALSIQVIT